jgi:hypothetical protein
MSILSFWIASWGGCQPWTHFQHSVVPRSFLISWSLVRLAHFCTPCTDHPCSNRSENLPGSSFYHLFSKYANRTSVLLFRTIWCLFHVLFLHFRHTCPTSQVMHRNAAAVYMYCCHILLQGCSCHTAHAVSDTANNSLAIFPQRLFRC